MSPTHTRRRQSMFKLFRRIITVGSVAVDDKKDLVWTGPHINVLVFSSQIPLAPPINVRSFRRVLLNLSHKMRLVTKIQGAKRHVFLSFHIWPKRVNEMAGLRVTKFLRFLRNANRAISRPSITQKTYPTFS